MKIINAMFSKVNGGLEQVFLQYTSTLQSQGCEVIPVIHPQAAIKNSCPADTVVTVHNYNQYDLFAIRKLRKLIDATQPDCIITHSYRAAYLFKKTRTTVPTVAVCHVRSHYDFGTDAIIALTAAMRQDIVDAGHAQEKVFTVPNMITIPQNAAFRPARSSGVPVIGACARFADIKGIDIFIQALAQLKSRAIPFHAKIAGDGKEKMRYVQMIRDLNLEREVTLLGWVEDKHSFYEQVDLFCLPSREEAFGLVILESMVHSLPMVLAKLPGPMEIIHDSESALLVPPCNPSAMADGIEQIIRDKNLANTLSKNAFQRVQQYASHRVGPILVDALAAIVRDKA